MKSPAASVTSLKTSASGTYFETLNACDGATLVGAARSVVAAARLPLLLRLEHHAEAQLDRQPAHRQRRLDRGLIRARLLLELAGLRQCAELAARPRGKVVDRRASTLLQLRGDLTEGRIATEGEHVQHVLNARLALQGLTRRPGRGLFTCHPSV